MFNWKKKSTNELSEHDQKILWNFIFTEIDKEKLENILWRMTYEPVETLREIGVEELESYQKLNKALKGDQYALYEIIRACKAEGYRDESGIAYTINCLKSTWKETGHKGLERMAFHNAAEIKFWEPHRKLISEFISEVYNLDSEEYRPEYNAEIFVFQQSQSSKKKDRKVDYTEQTEDQVSDTQKESVDYIVSADQVIKQKTEIQKFLNMCDEIPAFDWIITHQDVVSEYLQMLQNLPNHEAILYNRDKIEELLCVLNKF